MKVIIHNLLNRSQRTYEGDPISMERHLAEDYPWAVYGVEGDLDAILWHIDHSQYLSVEVQDPSPHPFLKV